MRAGEGKLPALKLADVKLMCGEWVHGMLDATFALESRLVDAECADGTSDGSLASAWRSPLRRGPSAASSSLPVRSTAGRHP